MSSFDLLSKPWIPVVGLNGKMELLGFTQVILRAHELSRISDPSPPIQFGLYRWLTVLVQAAFQLHEYEDLEDRWEVGRFPETEWISYIDRIGADRFDLFGRERPFMQTPAGSGVKSERKTVAELFYHLPKGNNALHFSFVEEDSHAVSPAVAARALSSISPFMTAGGRGYSPSVNGTPPWYVLPLGRNLFETLLLNCFVSGHGGPYGSDQRQPIGPAWEQYELVEPGAEKPVRSLFEGLTWQPRVVRLIPGEGGVCTYSGDESEVLIREVEWGPGHKVSQQRNWRDPNVAYSVDKNGTRLPVRPRENRHVWRDYSALFLVDAPEGGKEVFDRPDIVKQIVQLKSGAFLPKEAAEQYELYGMRADKAKIFEWHYASLPAKTRVVSDVAVAAKVEDAIETAELVSKALASSLKRLYPQLTDKKKKAQLKRSITDSQYHFWAQLEEVFQDELLERLDSLNPDDYQGREEAIRSWKSAVRRIALANFDIALSSVDTGAESYIKQAEARRAFLRSLRVILRDRQQEDSGEEEATVNVGP